MPDGAGRGRELLEELRGVFGAVGLLDILLPPLLFLVLNGLAGFNAAMIGALGLSLLIAAVRLRRGQSLVYALGGMGSVGLAIGLVLVVGRSEGFFLPGIVNGGVTVALALVSLLIRKPMVAWTSHFARRWPLEWYWHDRVRPAYTEVTVAWALFFGLRLAGQIVLLQSSSISRIALINTLLGWPAIILLLILSYLYGTWRLAQLGGPSVEEFREGRPAPWRSQRRGF
ncbi:MAG: DUF3159 domain-containing protein [Gemmatimonadales bacterium]|nr:DUF3159 domain-containing protein [Gemmatimonadales bacterium]